MSPIIAWGVGLAAIVVAFDTAALLATNTLQAESDALTWIGLLDQIANVALFSIVGFKVGRTTRLVRSAAEAGVVAGLAVGAANGFIGYAIGNAITAPSGARDLIGLFALNVAQGGVLAWISGFFATRPTRTNPRLKR